MARLYYESDADPTLIAGRKVAILGYGSQGHAHAQNLMESGVDVRVALRDGSSSRRKAEEAGLRVLSLADAAAEADVIMILLPDTEQKAAYDEFVAPNLADGDMLMFAHGFNIRFGQIVPPPGVDVTMVAPKGPGHLVRRTYTEGGGVPSLVAVHQDATGKARDLALVLRARHRCHPGRRARHDLRRGDRNRSLRRAGGALRRADSARDRRLRDPRQRRVSARVGLLRVPARAQAHRRPHVRAGHRRHALLHFGHGRVRRPDPRPRVINDAVRTTMQTILDDIRSGAFAEEWIAENKAGRPRFEALRKEGQAHQIESVGAELRAMMPFISAGKTRVQDASGG